MLERHTREISQISVPNKCDKAIISHKARELHPYLPQALKSSLGRKNEQCPDPNGRVHENIKHEFPDKIVAILLQQITWESEAQRERALTVKLT